MSYERANIRRMDGYVWGAQPDDARVVKLNTNENPFPAGPAVRAALASVDVAALRRYPSPWAQGFRRAAAEVLGTRPERIIATNGGDELLRLAITTFLDPGVPLATTRPSYSLYPVLAAVQDCPTVEFDLHDDFGLPADLAVRANEAGAGLFCLVNPHAPSGTLWPLEDVARLAEDFDGVLLLDEAYVDFVDPALGHDAIPLVEAFENVLILRSLSKGYSLAGLRFGFGIGAEALLEPMLTKTRDSYNVDHLAQTLATAAIGDRPWAADNHARVRAERERLAAALAERGFRCPPSQTNFLLARVPPPADAADLRTALEARSILVRHFAVPGLSDALRISVGTPEEDDMLLAALDELLA
ncbi:MAG: histidinol-phosphate transaminase [Pseudomonadales bacterium]|jgi:histidinol-phosphate aminotransferase|nr:histidinol-phosphate transaminase [Pseudomonadales bacterium]